VVNGGKEDRGEEEREAIGEWLMEEKKRYRRGREAIGERRGEQGRGGGGGEGERGGGGGGGRGRGEREGGKRREGEERNENEKTR
jgi:hypothetical protein